MASQHVQAIVVGSGFGGSVMTYRLAEAGQSVCLLERGQPYPPGHFPRSPYHMRSNLWDPSEGLYGLFNIWSFTGLESIISSGLGGGSLIYANVLLRKDERWFVHEDLQHGGYEYWPVSREDLDPHYGRVERMMCVQQYPLEHAPYDKTPKTLAFKAAAERLGLNWFLPNLAVTFANPGEDPVPGEPIREAYPNYHNRTRTTCRLCGECDIGCNYGSKNTLDYTYLTEAHRLGADIRTLCEVRTLEPIDGGGFRVQYVQHDLGRAGQKIDTSTLKLETLTADRVILSAGTYGSTFLLLKNRAAFPRISPLLGTRFSSNGDFLTFAMRCTDSRDGAVVPRLIDGSLGPVITSAVRMPDREDGGLWRGFYIQDAGYPEFINWMLQMVESPGAFWSARKVLLARLLQRVGGHPAGDISGDISRLFGDAELSAGLLPLLGMGRDVPNARMRLNLGKLDIDWSIRESDPYFNAVRSTMESMSDALGATFVDDPLWYLSRVITVHPLGGSPMGRHPGEGVVDSWGRVFNYPGLYIADGSVMPGPVGANPSLTIAALADRFADGILDCKTGSGV